MTAAATAPAFHLAHAAPGRVRLRALSALAPETMGAVVDSVMAAGGVRHVVGRPNTGSLIVETDEPAEVLLDRLAGAGLIRRAPRPKPLPVRDAARFGLMRAEWELAQRTDGALDLRTAFALVLAAAALYQLARGQVFGPALSMALGAASLLGAAEDAAAVVATGGQAD